MKLPKTVALTVAVSLLAVTRRRAQRLRCAAAPPLIPIKKRRFLIKDAGKIGTFIAALALAGAAANPGYAQDAEHGKTVFNACATCHATDHADRVGPGLEGIIGRKAGTAPGFHYSDAMKSSGIVWDAKILD